MVIIPFEWFEFAFDYFKSCSNGSNTIRMVIRTIQMVRIPLEWFEFAFGCFDSHSNGSNMHSIALKLVRSGLNFVSNG